MLTRNIEFAGHAITLCGRGGDSYFEHVEPDAPFSFAMSRLAAGSVVFDVGANIGVTATIASKSGAARVHAFEPDPAVFPFLLGTIEANSVAIEAHNMALGAAEGSLSFFSNPTSGSASHLVTKDTLGHGATSSVTMSTVDAFSKANHIEHLDLIKIDVEGFEIDVLRGAANTIQLLKPAALVEFNAFTMVGFRDINPRDLLRYLLATFPHVYRFIDGRPSLIDSDGAELAFIHDNLVSAGCVDDLYCSFTPI